MSMTRKKCVSALLPLSCCLGLLSAGNAAAAGVGVADRIDAAAKAYGLGKEILGDAANLFSGSGKCVRHIYSQAKTVWFVRSAGLGDGSGKWIPILPPTYNNGEVRRAFAERPANTETYAISYNGKGGTIDIKGGGIRSNGRMAYEDTFTLDGCGIGRSGSTGNAVLNTPEDGDIVFVELD